MFSIIVRLKKRIMKKAHDLLVMSSYDDFTIADFFRQQGAEIGEHSRIMIRSLGQEPYLIKIGNHCSISSGVIFVNHDGGGWIFTEEIPSLQRFGKIEIKDNCFLGINCTILPGVTIGPNAVIGAGSVVTKDVPPNSVACGNPARVVKTTEQYKNKILALWQEQKPEGYFHEITAGTRMHPSPIQALKNRDYPLLKRHLVKTLMHDKSSTPGEQE
jgi:acetyltransferase-like isoleucine patch superfamily enzyme